jgi:hypothetical protein
MVYLPTLKIWNLCENGQPQRISTNWELFYSYARTKGELFPVSLTLQNRCPDSRKRSRTSSGLGRRRTPSNGKGNLVCYTYSRLPLRWKEVNRWHRRELLPTVRTLEHFHKYPYGHAFHLRTDHSTLTLVMSFKNLVEQTARWVQRLQEYNFTSVLRQGRKHKYPDFLSRRPCQEECKHCHKVG